MQSEVVSLSTCTLVPSTVELAIWEPELEHSKIAIGANAEGLVVAYSKEGYRRPFVFAHIGIQRLDPNTLCVLRVAGLAASHQPENGGGGGPSTVSLEELTLHPSYIEVSGTFTGNTIYESPGASPTPIVQGSHFVATYPDFFGTTQRPPSLVTF